MARLLPVLAAVAFSLVPATASANDDGTAAGVALMAVGGLGLVAGVVSLSVVDNARDLAILGSVGSAAFVGVGSVVLATSRDRPVVVGVSPNGLQLRARF